MKTRIIVTVAAVAMLSVGCRQINRQIDALTVYPTTAKEVAETADAYNSDAALVVTKADTQYVLYRRQGGARCYGMRYVSQHRCKHDFSGRGGEFRLDEPEQAVVLTRNGDNAFSLTVDSITIAVADVATTDIATTFSFGFDAPDRTAVLYFYGTGGQPKDPFAETSIQQMLSLALSMDELMADWDADIDSGFVEAGEALKEASLALEVAEVEIEEAGDALKAFDYYDEYSRMDSIAGALGFTQKKTVVVGDNHLKYVVSGGRGGGKACQERMERMSEAAKNNNCHCMRYSVEHEGFSPRKCQFTIEW